jgi:hypothetical protein
MSSLVQFFLVLLANTPPVPALVAGWRNALGLGYRELIGRILVDLAAWIALHAVCSALEGAANLQCGNQPFDVQAIVFAHGQFVNEALGQNRQRSRLKSFNEGQEYEESIPMGRGKTKRNSISKSESFRWKIARFKTHSHLQQLMPVESMCIATGKAVLLPQERC